jgi:hypothetical protein
MRDCPRESQEMVFDALKGSASGWSIGLASMRQRNCAGHDFMRHFAAKTYLMVIQEPYDYFSQSKRCMPA